MVIDTLTRKIHTARLTLRHFGVIGLLRAVGLFLVQALVVYRRATIYVLDLRSVQGCPDATGVSFGYLDMGEVDRSLVAEYGINESYLRAQWECGNRFFVGADGDRQCYFCVVSTGGFTVAQRFRVSFDTAAEAYVSNCCTAATYRGRGIFPAALRALASALSREGKTALYGYVEAENDQSAAGVRKAGFVSVAEARIFRCGRLVSRRWRWLRGAESLPSHCKRTWRIALIDLAGTQKLNG
jgi:hypothetical protein